MIVRNLNNIKEQAASHEDSKSPGCLKKIIFAKKDFPKNLKPQMLNWARIPKGKSFKLHYHQDMLEVFIILSGKAQIRVGKEKKAVSKNQTIIVPENTDHAMKNIGRSDVEYLVIGLSHGLGGKTINRE